MGVCFYSSLGIKKYSGGVETVVLHLIELFSYKGIKSSIISWKIIDNNTIDNQFFLPNQKKCNSRQNRNFFEEYIIQNNITAIINVSGISYRSSMICIEITKKINIKLINVYHNNIYSMIQSNKILGNIYSNGKTGENIAIIMYQLLQFFPGYKGQRFLYENADASVFLSSIYVSEFCKLHKISSEKAYVIENPICIQNSLDDNMIFDKKEKTILFVGRLTKAKNVIELLEIFAELENKKLVSGYKFFILGDGEEKEVLVSMVDILGLSNVFFEGTVNPAPYYKKAEILCMASLYEGLPMVLLECQAFGVIPVVYNSFAAVKDLIISGLNGFIVPNQNRKKYIEKIMELCNNDSKRIAMGKEAIKFVKKFAPENIISKWLVLLKDRL